MTTIKAPPKECEQCGRLFHHNPRHSYEQWIIRRFCSRDCSLSYRMAHTDRNRLARQIALKMLADKQTAPPLVLRHRVPSTEVAPVWRITIIKK